MQNTAAGSPAPSPTFRDLVGPHLARLVAVARRILGSEDLAWDAVQEGLTALWMEGIRPSDPGAWLVRAVEYRSLHARRSGGRRRRHEECATGARARIAAQGDPGRDLERRELRAALEGALASLDEEQRRVIELREMQGLEYAAISRELRIPDGTVRSRLHRARAVLRVRLRSLKSDWWSQAEPRRARHEYPSRVA